LTITVNQPVGVALIGLRWNICCCTRSRGLGLGFRKQSCFIRHCRCKLAENP